MSDYKKWLNEIGLTEEQAWILINMDNVIEVEHFNYHKEKSNIHNIGVFASKNIKKGEVIGDVTIDNYYRTVLGRWVNHSKDKNAKFYNKKDNNLVAIAEKDILRNEEILIDYRDHTDKNPAFKEAIDKIKNLFNKDQNPKNQL
tara:strand:+ start:19 stop:450 length:432 start_codon:yes stop_codon:yes gene_type:complete